MRIKIFNIIFNIAIKNEYINNYLIFRFGGFSYDKAVSSLECEYAITQVDQDDLQHIGIIYEAQQRSMSNKGGAIVVNNTNQEVLAYNESFVYNAINERKMLVCICNYDKRTISMIASEIAYYISWVLTGYGYVTMHGGATTFHGNINNGIAYLGDNGSGKSSIIMRSIELGEKITNDDALYIDMANHSAIKNIQPISLLDIEKYPYLRKYVIKNDHLYHDKYKIDMAKYSTDVYTNKLHINTLIWVSNQRSSSAEIRKIDKYSFYKYLVRASNQFCKVNDALHSTLLDFAISKECLWLVPSTNVDNTVAMVHKYMDETSR